MGFEPPIPPCPTTGSSPEDDHPPDGADVTLPEQTSAPNVPGQKPARRQREKKADQALLLALAGGASSASAARQTGLSERTVRRRLADPDFAAALAKTRAEMLQRTIGMFSAASVQAVKTLRALLIKTEPAPVRLKAARAILELGPKLREETDTAAKLRLLEELLGDPSALPDLRGE